MKRLSMLLMLVALLGVNAFAQTSRTSHVSQSLGKAKPTMLGSSQRILDCDTFVNLCSDDTLVVYTSQCTAGVPGGYVCGHNCYGDKSKADIFYLPGTTIKGALLYFGVGKNANTTDKVNVRVWDNDGTFADGGTGGPGTVLGTATITYKQINTDVTAGNLSYVQFPTPITMPADSLFYLGIDYSYKKNDTVALVNVLDRTNSGLSCSDVNTSVDRFSDNTWHRFTDADDWGLATSQMILPITCHDVVSCTVTITPPSATICKKASVGLVASGATTYTWAPATGLNVTTGTTVTAKPNSTTTYTVTGTTGGGTCTNTVKVTVNPAPTATATAAPCSGGAVLLTRSGTPTTGVTFQWFKGATAIAGATNSTYSATKSATYKVKVTITATGCNVTSKGVAVTISCKLGDAAAAQFNADAFPNPFANSVTINISSGSSELANVKLMDFSGRLVHEYKNVDPSAPFEINEDLAPGVYFVRVNQGSNEKMIKVVKD